MPHKTNQADEWFMRRALALAERGRPLTSPNPLVGACLVKSGRLIAEGHHARFGGPHAEIEAIRKAARKSRGATLYVTLEPCSTYGKTPPCTAQIIEAGIRRVVIGMIDPNPKHRGRGANILKKHGIRVTTGVLLVEAKQQNEAYVKWTQTGLPFVILKMAQSLDGKIATRTGAARWISGPQARVWVHRLRAACDAMLVGTNTVLKDNPRLTTHNGAFAKKEPWRMVLDREGVTPLSARLFKGGGQAVLVCAERNIGRLAKKFQRVPVTFVPVKLRKGKLDLKELLRKLGTLGIASLLVEGGGELAWSFLSLGLVDKIYWIVAPKLIGGRLAKTSVEGEGILALDRAPYVRISRFERLGHDFLIEGYFKD